MTSSDHSPQRTVAERIEAARVGKLAYIVRHYYRVDLLEGDPCSHAMIHLPECLEDLALYRGELTKIETDEALNDVASAEPLDDELEALDEFDDAEHESSEVAPMSLQEFVHAYLLKCCRDFRQCLNTALCRYKEEGAVWIPLGYTMEKVRGIHERLSPVDNRLKDLEVIKEQYRIAEEVYSTLPELSDACIEAMDNSLKQRWTEAFGSFNFFDDPQAGFAKLARLQMNFLRTLIKVLEENFELQPLPPKPAPVEQRNADLGYKMLADALTELNEAVGYGQAEESRLIQGIRSLDLDALVSTEIESSHVELSVPVMLVMKCQDILHQYISKGIQACFAVGGMPIEIFNASMIETTDPDAEIHGHDAVVQTLRVCNFEFKDEDWRPIFNCLRLANQTRSLVESGVTNISESQVATDTDPKLDESFFMEMNDSLSAVSGSLQFFFQRRIHHLATKPGGN